MSRHSQTLAIVVVLFFGCAAWAMLAFWRANRVSPQFRSTSQYTYRSIRKCDEKLTESNPLFRTCIDEAEKAFAQLEAVAGSHRERVQYALLGSYLRKVRDCRKDWDQSDVSADAKDRLSSLALSRRDLEKRLSED